MFMAGAGEAGDEHREIVRTCRAGCRPPAGEPSLRDRAVTHSQRLDGVVRDVNRGDARGGDCGSSAISVRSLRAASRRGSAAARP